MKFSLNIKKLNDKATVPTYGSACAAGADLYACTDTPITIAPSETYIVHTGIAMAIPDGYVGLVYARSGLASKRVIDSDYRGEIMVALHNHSNTPQIIEHGERIAQIVFTPYVSADFNITDELDSTERGAGGFGSTGTK